MTKFDAPTVNGAFAATHASAERQGRTARLQLTVRPDGATALFKRSGIKWPGGRRVETLVGELDGVRVYLSERDGRAHAVLTRAEVEL